MNAGESTLEIIYLLLSSALYPSSQTSSKLLPLSSFTLYFVFGAHVISCNIPCFLFAMHAYVHDTLGQKLSQYVLRNTHSSSRLTLHSSVCLSCMQTRRTSKEKMADTSKIPGKWQMTSSDNFDAFMSALGIGYVTRKLGNASKPLVTVTHEGDKEFSFKQESLLKVSPISRPINTHINCTERGERSALFSFHSYTMKMF